VWPVAIVGLERVRECLGALLFVAVAVGICPALEQGADEALGFPVGLWPVGARFADADPELVAALAPAALEAGAVVGQDALDPDPALAVEAIAGGEEGERGVGGLVGVDGGEAEPGRIIDENEQVLPAGLAPRSFRAVAGNAMPRLDDPADAVARTDPPTPRRADTC
jgi:hypothetical protein